jgi:hypothetical protein
VSGLVLLNGGNGHRSASQRREEQLLAFNDHLLKVIAVLTIQQGGLSMVSGASLKRQYDLTTTRDPLTGNLVYSAKPTPGDSLPLMPALDEAARELDAPTLPDKEPVT